MASSKRRRVLLLNGLGTHLPVDLPHDLCCPMQSLDISRIRIGIGGGSGDDIDAAFDQRCQNAGANPTYAPNGRAHVVFVGLAKAGCQASQGSPEGTSGQK